MPTIRVPNVISYYTDKQTQFEVSGSTVLEAVQSAVENSLRSSSMCLIRMEIYVGIFICS